MFILVILHQLVLALHHLLEMVFGIGELGQYRAQASVTGLQLDHLIIGGKNSNFNKGLKILVSPVRSRPTPQSLSFNYWGFLVPLQ